MSTAVYLLKRALSMPPHMAVRKALGLGRRTVAARRRRARDLRDGSHGYLDAGTGLARRMTVTTDALSDDLVRALTQLCPRYLEHEFDLLGSGWTQVAYGMACPGMFGRTYPSGPTVEADRHGTWLEGRVNRSNLSESQRIWRLIDDAEYRPLDWQIDFKSGYRWRQDSHAYDLTIPVDAGADVKVPWELARLQHLPQLALAAIAAGNSGQELPPQRRIVSEIRNQMLDFLAQNPPRFGVNWLCPMDVAIRAVNFLLAADLLAGAGLSLDVDFQHELARAAREHRDHVLAHLEWSETGRSNHYLADIVGVLWTSAYLPLDNYGRAAAAFAARELVNEADTQFLDDGGNYEGSSNYHCLSGELVSFGLALILGLEARAPDLFDAFDPRAIKVRVPFAAGALPSHRHGNGVRSVVSPAAWAKLVRAGRLARRLRRPDGTMVQVGDTDSGRLCKLEPRLDPSTGRGQDLDSTAFASAVAALSETSGIPLEDFVAQSARLETAVIRSLSDGTALPRAGGEEPLADFGDLASLVTMLRSLPEGQCHYRQFDVRAARGAWSRCAFPAFGLFMFWRGNDRIFFRCAPAAPANAPTSHRHDDNLSVEMIVGGTALIEDPGTYVYTASRRARDAYRSAAAHDCPRAAGWDVAAPGEALFELRQQGFGRCLAWRPDGVAGLIQTPKGTLWRVVLIEENRITIVDGTDSPDGLRPLSDRPRRCLGYGRKS
ncbi:MAG: heparinase II/III family protein [Kiloniellaceae bacterium]